MHVTIIVPVFNEAAHLPRFLSELVPGVQGDPLAICDLIVVDGGSTDGTRELLQSSGVDWMSASRGRASQMNAGAAATSADLLLFLHADTILPPDALTRMRDAIAAGAVGGHFQVRLDSSKPLLRLTGRMITWRSRITGVASGDQAIFVSRSAFDQLGGFALLPLFEDLDLSRRLKRLGSVVSLRVPVVTSARRWEKFGVGRTILRMWLLRLLYYVGIKPDWLARYYGIAR